MTFADEAASGPIYKIVLDDVIHAVSAEHIIETLAEANAEDAVLVLIQLSTPGGLYQATREIIEAILGREWPVVVYVAPSGVHAASAGFLITLIADVAVMAPGTNTGAATPVSGSGQEMDETMQKKVRSDAAAHTRSIAERRGKDPALAEHAVTEARAWTANEALEAGIVDCVASSEAELLVQLEGATVKRIDGNEVTLTTAIRSVELKEMSTKQRILSVIANPNLAVLLGLLGLAGLHKGFSNPGAIVPVSSGLSRCCSPPAYSSGVVPMVHKGASSLSSSSRRLSIITIRISKWCLSPSRRSSRTMRRSSPKTASWRGQEAIAAVFRRGGARYRRPSRFRSAPSEPG
jgi:membrane-bound serine protease (ClpP class)